MNVDLTAGRRLAYAACILAGNDIAGGTTPALDPDYAATLGAFLWSYPDVDLDALCEAEAELEDAIPGVIMDPALNLPEGIALDVARTALAAIRRAITTTCTDLERGE